MNVINNLKNLKNNCMAEDKTLCEAIKKINKSNIKIVLLINKKNRLCGVINDGDIRRAILRGANLDDRASTVMQSKPLIVHGNTDPVIVKEIMKVNKIAYIPILDKKNLLKGLYTSHGQDEAEKNDNLFVLMVGGKGIRMRPFTIKCPKPMLLINGKPILEHILIKAINDGFRNFYFCINYLGHQVKKYFKNGNRWGVQIKYIREKKPLGTAGGIGLLPRSSKGPFIITNGDVLTNIDYSQMLKFHNNNNSFATMAVYLYQWKHMYGIIETNGIEITDINEKPISKSYINAGVYVLSSEAIRLIPQGKYIDMTDFFLELKSKRKRVLAYPLHEPWLDVGRPNDLAQATSEKSLKLL